LKKILQESRPFLQVSEVYSTVTTLTILPRFFPLSSEAEVAQRGEKRRKKKKANSVETNFIAFHYLLLLFFSQNVKPKEAET